MEEIARIKIALIPILDNSEIILAYLFGSIARGNNNLSDIDIAVLINEEVVKDFFGTRIGLMNRINEVLKIDNVDIVILNEVTPLLKYRVFRDGILIYEKNKQKRLKFERETMMEYFDTAPLRKMYSDVLRRKVLEGEPLW